MWNGSNEPGNKAIVTRGPSRWSGMITAEPSGFDQRDERTAVAVLAADVAKRSGTLDGRRRLAARRASAVSELEQRRPVVEGVGRVDEREVDSAWRGLTGENSSTSARTTRTPGAAVEAGRGEVGVDRRDRAAVALDEGDRGGAARERLDAERTRSREQVEHRSRPRRRRGLSRMSKIASRTRSLVGRRPGDAGGPKLATPARAADHRMRTVERRAAPVSAPEAGTRVLVLGDEQADLVAEQRVRRPRPGSSSTIASATVARPRTRSWSRRSEASRRSLRPFWRMPRTVPSPRSSRSTSASSKPSSVASSASSRARRRLGDLLGEQVAPGLVASPRPTRPRSWWSWAMPKRSASSMTITVAFGDVDADLDDRRGDEHLELARPKGRHRRLLLLRRQLAVQEADREGRRARRQRGGRAPRPPSAAAGVRHCSRSTGSRPEPSSRDRSRVLGRRASDPRRPSRSSALGRSGSSSSGRHRRRAGRRRRPGGRRASSLAHALPGELLLVRSVQPAVSRPASARRGSSSSTRLVEVAVDGHRRGARDRASPS